MEVAHVTRLCVLIAAVVSYYAWGISALGRVTRPAGRRWLARTAWAGRYTTDEAESLVGLLVAVTSQAALFALVLAVAGLPIVVVTGGGTDPRLIGLGAVLGVGEAALASFIGYVALRALDARARAQQGGNRAGDGPGDARVWLATGRGGWMRLYLRTAEIAPWWLLITLTAFYVTVEEAVFRGLLVPMLSPYGAAVAVAGSAVLFTAVQVLHMPSWPAGVFPAAGGLVVGVIHGVLFVTVGDLAPLVVAHLTMFLVFVW